jgi:hypothetical protein
MLLQYSRYAYSCPTAVLQLPYSCPTVVLQLSNTKLKVKVKLTLEQATKAQNGGNGTALTFL